MIACVHSIIFCIGPGVVAYHSWIWKIWVGDENKIRSMASSLGYFLEAAGFLLPLTNSSRKDLTIESMGSE